MVHSQSPGRSRGREHGLIRLFLALERASVGEDIVPFGDSLTELVRKRVAGEPLLAVPKMRPS
jgi:hypothetical protein